jgi:mercuric ion transport protein
MSLKNKSSNKLLGAGVITAIAASLCCITPVLALIAGVSGAASAFSWLEPARPYFLGITVAVLGFAWYQKLKPRTAEEIDCDCEEDEKPSFLQSKKFLGIVTVFAAAMLAFPHYSGIFYPDNSASEVVYVQENNIVEASLIIDGMTCTACESHVTYAINKNDGILDASASFEEGTAKIKFDKSKVTIDQLAAAVEKETGYKVIDKKIQ